MPNNAIIPLLAFLLQTGHGEWSHYCTVAEGDHLRSGVNGIACADFHDNLDASGFSGRQVRSVPAGTGPYQARWKNIRLRELRPREQAD